MDKKVKDFEIRIGRDFGKKIGYLIDHPKELDKEPRRVLYVDDLEMLAAIISNKKLQLIKFIGNNKISSVSELAKKLNRKQEAVSRDISKLESVGLLKKERKGKNIVPKIAAKSITISLTG